MSQQTTYDETETLKYKVKYYSSALRRTLHLKFTLANLICAGLPKFVSGVLRTRLYRWSGFQIGEGTFIMGNLNLPTGQASFYEKLKVGTKAVIGDHVTINLDAEVSIGNMVAIGPHVLIYTGTHQMGPGSGRRLDKVIAKPVKIEDGSWIGLAAIILPGVTIGHGSVIAAGAVVTQDVPPDSLVEGNPGKVIQKLPWGNR